MAVEHALASSGYTWRRILRANCSRSEGTSMRCSTPAANSRISSIPIASGGGQYASANASPIQVLRSSRQYGHFQVLGCPCITCSQQVSHAQCRHLLAQSPVSGLRAALSSENGSIQRGQQSGGWASSRYLSGFAAHHALVMGCCIRGETLLHVPFQHWLFERTSKTDIGQNRIRAPLPSLALRAASTGLWRRG